MSREAVRHWRNDALVLLRLPAVCGQLARLCDQQDRQDSGVASSLNRTWLASPAREAAMISTLLPTHFPQTGRRSKAANSPFHQLSGFTSRTEFNEARALACQ